jgi:hypothetical protein
MSDCPDCHRLNAIDERLRKFAPNGHDEDAVWQLKADAEWMSKQLRGWQQWAVRVVTLQDHIDSLLAAVYALPPKAVAERAERVRQEYEGLFGQPKREA